MSGKKLLLGAAGMVLAGWLIWGNCAPQTGEYRIFHPDLPEGFDGFRIAQISDLHNAEFGKGNQNLLRMLEKAQPDMIVLTGDIIDCRNPDIPVAVSFVEEAVKTAPCYYVTGNHEARIADPAQQLQELERAGAVILRNEKLTLTRKADTLTLLGIDDPSFTVDYMTGENAPVIREALVSLTEPTDGYTVLLSHRPEWFSLYREYGVNLTFSGHAHGGQFRFPFVGGLIAPNQGFFPEYDAGVFNEEGCSMVVSRGLGASIIPLRIGNRPELVVVELHRQEA